MYARAPCRCEAALARWFFLSRVSLDLERQAFPRESFSKLQKPLRIADFSHIAIRRCGTTNIQLRARTSAADGCKNGVGMAKPPPKKNFQQGPESRVERPDSISKPRESNRPIRLRTSSATKTRDMKRPDSTSGTRMPRRKTPRASTASTSRARDATTIRPMERGDTAGSSILVGRKPARLHIEAQATIVCASKGKTRSRPTAATRCRTRRRRSRDRACSSTVR